MSEGIDSDIPAAPSGAQMDRLHAIVAPLARITQPMVIGLEQVPERRVLFVGNHTTFGLLDVPFMMAAMWERRRIVVRGLGDHGHYKLPIWRELLTSGGMVRGTRDNVRALMRAKEPILVYPGGGGEVFKRRGEKYQLKWKERLGFARLAVEFGYPIVPFAGVGAEEMFDVIADDRTPGVHQISELMHRLVGISAPPIPRGIGPTLIPRPERLYFWFGEPIETAPFAGAGDDGLRRLRDAVRDAVEGGIELLLAEREGDPRRGLRQRLLHGGGRQGSSA